MFIPQYSVGHSVWFAGTSFRSERWPCPDCHGSKQWLATTATGEQIAVECPRCTSYSSNRLPSLTHQIATTLVQRLTIGSVRTDTSQTPKQQVQYMCLETGVGSGQLYSEDQLHSTQEQAKAAAEVLRTAEQLRLDQEPQHLLAEEFAGYPLQVALVNYQRCGNLAGWDAALRYKEAIREVLNRGNVDEADYELLDDVTQDLPWPRPHPVDELIDTVKAWILCENPVDLDKRIAVVVALDKLGVQ